MIFADPNAAVCGGCGPSQGDWRCAPCERESKLEAYYGAFHQAPEAAAVTTGEMASGLPPTTSILYGVGTGLAVWILTRVLDRWFFHDGPPRY